MALDLAEQLRIGKIVDPVTPIGGELGSAFVTPSAMRHAHHNESGAPAHLIPIQDASLQAYLRCVDIRFTDHRCPRDGQKHRRVGPIERSPPPPWRGVRDG